MSVVFFAALFVATILALTFFMCLWRSPATTAPTLSSTSPPMDVGDLDRLLHGRHAQIAAATTESAPARFRVHLINMEHHKGRLAHFLGQLSASDLGVQADVFRYRAVDARKTDLSSQLTPPAALKLARDHKRGFRDRHDDLALGAIGCYMSHYGLYRAIAESSCAKGPSPEYHLVMEDDATINPDFVKLLEHAMPLPEDWDIVLLGFGCRSGGGCRAAPGRPRRWIEIRGFYLTHAYLLNPRAIPRMIKDMLPVDVQIDAQLGRMAKAGTIRIYGLAPERRKDVLSSQATALFGTTIQELEAREPF